MSRACFATLLLVAAVVVSLFWRTAADRPFFYDEADYMYAGTQGFVNNYLDRPSISTIDFVLEGLSMARDKTHNSDKSKAIRSAGDITFYRHYHGPVYAYWIALCQAMGCRAASDYRASGLVIHTLTAIVLFISFRLSFPEYSALAALAGSLAFLLNRTGLVAATTITQHVMFAFMASLTMLALALFCRTRQMKFWYLTTAALGVAFSTVETSFILVGAVVAVLLITNLHSGWRSVMRLLGRGTLVFLAAVLVVWPKGVLALGGLKGYMYLAYMAIVRKTFTPIGPVALWSFKLRHYPEEFVIPFVSLILLTVFWKKLAARHAALPYLAFTWMFGAATLIITLPYSYYLDALLLSAAAVTGIAFGEVWKRSAIAGGVAGILLLGSLSYMTARYYQETVKIRATHDPRTDLLSYIQSDNRGQALFVPFELVPTIHFYMPQLTTTGYDGTWTAARLADALNAAPHAELLCEQKVCETLRPVAHLAPLRSTPVMGADVEVQKGPLYSYAPNR